MHIGIRHGSDYGAVKEAIGYDIEDLTRLRSQDACEVSSLLTGERGVGGVAGLRRPQVGDEATAHRAGNREQQSNTKHHEKMEAEKNKIPATTRLRLCVLAFCSLFTVPCYLIVRFRDGHVDRGLVDKVEGNDCGRALVPFIQCDGEGEKDHA